MNSIELTTHFQLQCMKYLSNTFKNDTINKQKIKNFFISLESDDTTFIYPSYGDFTWTEVDTGEEFQISYREEGEPVHSSMNDVTYFKRMRISHDNLDILQEFIEKALKYNEPSKTINTIRVYNANSIGYFELYGPIHAQPFEYIFIPPEIKSQITSHIDKFHSLKDRYIKFGRAYKTSFLLTGVAGSGKSSIVKSLAMKYNKPVYMLTLSKSLTDDKLIDLLSSLKDDCILLIEDIDSFFIDRQPVNINISFSAIINFMDGVLGKGNGVITFLTANNPDRLDPAMIRPGRVDIIVKFDYPKKKEIREAFVNLTEVTDSSEFDQFYDQIKNLKISMSGIVDYLFRNPDTYAVNINDLINNNNILQDIISDKLDKLYS